jgi:hypothetical protein
MNRLKFGADYQLGMIWGTKGTAAYISPKLMDNIKKLYTREDC